MCRFLVPASFLILRHAGCRAAPVSSGFYQPPPVPLGVLVARSKAIRVLEVVDVGPEVVKFKTTTTLKGQAQEVPFDSFRIEMNEFAAPASTRASPSCGSIKARQGRTMPRSRALGRRQLGPGGTLQRRTRVVLPVRR